MLFNRDFIKSVVPDAQFMGVEFPQVGNFSIDSRTLLKGDIFIALQGSRVDGGDFIADALKKGASGIILSSSNKSKLSKLDATQLNNCAIAIVPDSRSALIELATAWRSGFAIPIIGITGSVGKTTTKDMLAHIFASAGKKCLASLSNQNTIIGAALNVLKLNKEYDIAVFEMGVNKRGEMARLAHMIKPTAAVITTVGHSHMEGLGGVNDIAVEKRDIFKYFKEDNIGVINGDHAILAAIAYNHPIIKFGCKMTNQVQARKIQVQGSSTHFVLKLYREKHKVVMATSHNGPVVNGLAAASIAHMMGVSGTTIVNALQSWTPVSSRFECRPITGNRGILIDDCYNASPESMKAALLAFERFESKGKKIAVLGDMLELGVNAPFWHRQLGRFLRKVPSLTHVIFVGENVKWAQKTLPAFITYEIVPAWKDALDCVQKRMEAQSVILVKGSHSIGLQNLVNSMVNTMTER